MECLIPHIRSLLLLMGILALGRPCLFNRIIYDDPEIFNGLFWVILIYLAAKTGGVNERGTPSPGGGPLMGSLPPTANLTGFQNDIYGTGCKDRVFCIFAGMVILLALNICRF